MQADISIITETDNYALPLLRVLGEVDVHTCGKVNKALADLTEHADHILLDIDKVDYLDSTGLGGIAHVAKQLAQKDGHIYMICTKPQIKKIFEISGLKSKNISLHESINAALEANN